MADSLTLTKTRPRHTIRIFRHDPTQPRRVGINPIQIDTLTIDWQNTVPRRERAAVAAVQAKCGATPMLGHSPNGDLVATITAPGSVQPAPQAEAPMLSEEAVRELLRSPVVMRELHRIAGDQRNKG